MDTLRVIGQCKERVVLQICRRADHPVGPASFLLGSMVSDWLAHVVSHSPCIQLMGTLRVIGQCIGGVVLHSGFSGGCSRGAAVGLYGV